MQRHRHFEDKSIFAHSLKNRLLLSACCSIIVLYAGTLWARSEPVSFSPPSQKHIIDTASVPLSPAMFSLLNATASQKPQALRQVLDSLGYFSASIDSSANTITVRPGYQCRVDSVIIHSMVPCAVDSIQRNMFPRPYDAGELQMLAQRIVYFFGRKGYPFAELTVGVSPVRNDSGAHASHIPSVTITYDVRVNGFYVWGEPFIVGQIQTSPNLLKQDILIKKGDIFDVAAIATSKKRLQTRQYIASVETGQAGIERDVKPCADTVTGLAFTHLDEVIDFTKQNSEI